MNQIIESRLSHPMAATTGLRAGSGRLLLRAAALVNLWYERHRQRQYLARLDERLLRDIGIERASAELEISKPFWRP